MGDFAKRSGISKAYISMLERNKNPKTNDAIVPSLEMIKKVSTTIGIDLNIVLDHLDPEQEISLNKQLHFNEKIINEVEDCVKIPILGKIAAGLPIEAIENILGYEQIPERLSRKGRYFALEIQGSSMAPIILPGDVAIVRQQNTINDSELAVVIINGQDATVKKVIKRSGFVKLVPFNPNYDPFIFTDEEVENFPVTILGKIIEIRRKFN